MNIIKSMKTVNKDNMRIVKPVLYSTARKGSKRSTHFRAMINYLAKHPRATVAEVLTKTSFNRQDLIVSLKRKRIALVK